MNRTPWIFVATLLAAAAFAATIFVYGGPVKGGVEEAVEASSTAPLMGGPR